MKKFLLFAGVVVVIMAVFYMSLYVFIDVKGKDIILGNIKENLGVEASLDSLSLKFPFSIEIKGFKCADISFKKANISLGPANPFNFRLTFNKVFIEGLNVKMRKDRKKIELQPFFIKDNTVLEKKSLKKIETIIPVSSKSFAKKKISLQIRNVRIKNGSGEFLDLTGKKPLSFIVKDINLKLKNFVYPELTKFYINLTASLKTNKGAMEDVVGIDGWVDYFNRNMDIKLRVDPVDYALFSEYYSSSWGPDNFKIKEAYLSLTSALISQNNGLVIDSMLFLEKIEFKEEEESSRKDFVKTIIALLEKDNGRTALRFKLITKMDSPKLDFSFFKDNFKRSISINPAFIAGEVADGAGKVISESIDGTKKITIDATIDALKKTVDSVTDILESSVGSSNEE